MKKTWMQTNELLNNTITTIDNKYQKCIKIIKRTEQYEQE